MKMYFQGFAFSILFGALTSCSCFSNMSCSKQETVVSLQSERGHPTETPEVHEVQVPYSARKSITSP